MDSLPNPPIGWPILWYPKGDINQLPATGQVSMNSAPGSELDILIFAPQGGLAQRKSNVPNVRLTSRVNPTRLERHGAWDYVPGLVPEESAPRWGEIKKHTPTFVPHWTPAAEAATDVEPAERVSDKGDEPKQKKEPKRRKARTAAPPPPGFDKKEDSTALEI